MGYQVTVFKPYEFSVGQKIRIDGGKRRGDWEVVGIDEKTLTLRCPISKKEFTWNRFCYEVAQEPDAQWPQID